MKYRMWCKETAQQIRDESYGQVGLPSKPIKDAVHKITKTIAAIFSKKVQLN